MEDQYYTPEIEDITIGYECELLRITIGEYDTKPDNIWVRSIVDKYEFINLSKSTTRTPYLTKEQIEKEGWKFYRVTMFDKFPTLEEVKQRIENINKNKILEQNIEAVYINE